MVFWNETKTEKDQEYQDYQSSDEIAVREAEFEQEKEKNEKLQGDFDEYRKQARDDWEEINGVLSEKLKEIKELDNALKVKTRRMEGWKQKAKDLRGEMVENRKKATAKLTEKERELVEIDEQGRLTTRFKG